jgi:predicted aspartyl protease
VGRFSVQFEIANQEDEVKAKAGLMKPEQVRRKRLSGVVDTGATRLVLPATVAAALGVPVVGRVKVRFADGREDERQIVGMVTVEIAGRSSVFTAVVEPGREDALIGAFVLEELDLIPDCGRQALVPRYPGGIFAEIDSHSALDHAPGGEPSGRARSRGSLSPCARAS